MVITKRRQEAEFLKTRALIEAIQAPHVEKSNLQEAFQDYSDSVFPYMQKMTTREEQDVKQALERWTSQVAFNVKPLWRANEHKSIYSRLKKGAQKIKEAEMSRRIHKHRRIG